MKNSPDRYGPLLGLKPQQDVEVVDDTGEVQMTGHVLRRIARNGQYVIAVDGKTFVSGGTVLPLQARFSGCGRRLMSGDNRHTLRAKVVR